MLASDLNSVHGILKYMGQEMFLLDEVTSSKLPLRKNDENVAEVTSWEMVRTGLRWSHLKWPKALVVTAAGESGLSCSDGVLALAHITLVPPYVPILKDDLKYRKRKMNLELELSLHQGRPLCLDCWATVSWEVSQHSLRTKSILPLLIVSYF